MISFTCQLLASHVTLARVQITEVLRALLDPDSMEGREQDDFLNLFYESHIHELAQPIVGPAASGAHSRQVHAPCH